MPCPYEFEKMRSLRFSDLPPDLLELATYEHLGDVRYHLPSNRVHNLFGVQATLTEALDELLGDFLTQLVRRSIDEFGQSGVHGLSDAIEDLRKILLDRVVATTGKRGTGRRR